jgi:hypothetical protein
MTGAPASSEASTSSFTTAKESAIAISSGDLGSSMSVVRRSKPRARTMMVKTCKYAFLETFIRFFLVLWHKDTKKMMKYENLFVILQKNFIVLRKIDRKAFSD